MNVFNEKDSVKHTVIKEYSFGSVVYGTSLKDSDEDYIAVVDSEENLAYNVRGEKDYIVYSEDLFIQGIKNHEIYILECIFQDKNDVYRKYFELDKGKLRKNVSSIASNSYVKCKKKIQDGEEYIGLKSLFHSIRILDYGIQIAKYKEIVDYKSANIYFDDIMTIGGDWNILHKKYKPIYNQLKSELRELCPLN